MRCVHNKEGCSWEGEKSQLSSHLECCEFDVKDCPADCGNKVSYFVLQEHLNSACKTKYSKRCEYCGAIFSAENEKTHVATCQQLPVPCPNNCLVGCVPRAQLNYHLTQDCEMNVLVCPFNVVGCKYKADKNKSNKHLKDNLDAHLFKLNIYVQQTINKLMTENKRLSTHLNELTLTVNKQNEENKRLSTRLNELTLTVNKQNEENKRLSTRLNELTLTVNKQNEENKRLHTSLKELTVTVNKQNEENKGIKVQNERFSTSLNKLTVTVNNPNQENERLKTENEFMWTFDNFEMNMKNAKTESTDVHCSPMFYSHTNGYKMTLTLYLNKYTVGKLNYLSLYWNIVTGEFDDLLNWPFPYEIELTLVDQHSDPNQVANCKQIIKVSSIKIQKPTEEVKSNGGWGFPIFISHKELYKRSFIKDDKIVIKAKVIKISD